MNQQHTMRTPMRCLAALTLSLASACGDGGKADVDQESVAEGREIVKGRLCASCHGMDLSGAKAPYPNTESYPPNLTSDEATGLGAWMDEEVISAILDSVGPDGQQLCNVMPAYGDDGMTEEQAAAVVAYLRSLPSVEHAVPESVECESVDP